MVRCEEFYKEFERKGNFCGKSPGIVKQVEHYIEYMKRNKFGDFLISNSAIEPLIKIEHMNYGKVHKVALSELRKKARKVGASRITRKISIEIINQANLKVDEQYKIKSIPDIRAKMGIYEHAIEGISSETRDLFDTFKKVHKLKGNNETIIELLKLTDNNPLKIISST